ncbi:MAG: hypothetical protein IJ679_07550 [Lachnospiraceae bacterium]|nr:hypothetical protein [Lachnospiraceae bacterium]
MTRGGSLRASLTVEAAWVFGIALLVIYGMMGVSFALYRDAFSFVENTGPDDWKALQTFRLLQMGKDALEGMGK